MTDPRARAGSNAEAAACEYLEARGLRVLERNYRSPFGEIDLIMRDGPTTVFVEVRYRRSGRFGGAAETVDRQKQHKLRATAEHYLQRHGRANGTPCRFDVLALEGEAAPAIAWLQNAF